MFKQKKETKSRFSLEGRFVGFVGDFGKQPKHIRVTTSDGERYIKLLKKLRGSVIGILEPGDWVQISGKQKYKKKTGKLKLKAAQLKSITPAQQKTVSPSPIAAPRVSEKRSGETSQQTRGRGDAGTRRMEIPRKISLTPAPKSKACVMVCQKSSCRKRGGSKVSQSVADYLQERGWENQVAIKGTGCMKQCKKGPCVVFMPDKCRHTNVDPKQVPALMEKHF